MKTKLDIINEVANNYNSANRSYDGDCLYSITMEKPEKNTPCCGVGRFFDPEKTPNFVWKFIGTIESLSKKIQLINIFRDDVKHLSNDLEFWDDIQSFHDGHDFWNNSGLSDYGKTFYKELLGKYS
jgi:hypothetical protein